MPSVVAPNPYDTIAIDRPTIAETLALLHAASAIFIVLNDSTETELVFPFDNGFSDLKTAAFGVADDDDDETWGTDPDHVEAYARGYEIAADALEKAARGMEDIVLSNVDVAKSVPGCVREWRADAKAMRKQGTVNPKEADDA